MRTTAELREGFLRFYEERGHLRVLSHSLIPPADDPSTLFIVAVDEAVRAVSFAVKRPIQKLVGVSAGARHGWATMRAKRDVKAAVASGKEAAARREADFEDDLRRAHG